MTIKDFLQTKTNGRFDDITEMAQEEGGFGRLYRARDRERQQTEVCIKVIKPILSKDLQIKLWNDEMTALKRYNKRSGIVHLVEQQYEFTHDDPYWFLVMDYIHGERLGSSKYRIELNVEEDLAMLLLFQLCSVIYSIHQRGEYHQDIFPDNVKVQDKEHLVLLDLGGMREAERRSGTIIFGGEMYSSPEVSPTRLRMRRFRTLRKERMGSFESADIFSIGALFFELMMGVPFFESVEQSNQLKEYIYDYYADPDMVKRMKTDYKEAIEQVHKNINRFYEFLEQYQLPKELCEYLSATLAIHPKKRPTIETLLQYLLPYMTQRAAEYYHQKRWAQAARWAKYPLRHLEEIRLESQDDDVVLSQKMEQHVTTHLSSYLQLCLIKGGAFFYQDEIAEAQQTFITLRGVLDQYNSLIEARQWNTCFLKTMSNLAACQYKHKQRDDAAHLYKSLSTAQGDFGQIINHNLRACAQ